MKKLRFGLQSRFLLGLGATLLVVGAIMAMMLVRQAAVQREVTQLSGTVIHDLFERNVRAQGASLTRALADALVNPLYYSDLDAIGALVRSAASQQLVRYVLVHDPDGRLIHDGSIGVSDYGRQMQDPLAAGAIAAQSMTMQDSPSIVEVAMPILIGNQRIGGVRVGLELEQVRREEADVMLQVGERLDALGKRHLGWLSLMMLVLVGFGAGIAMYAQHTLVRPVRWLASAARRIESGDYGIERRDSSRGDEVGELVRVFGRMSESIARHDRQVRQMAYTDALTGLTNRLAFREELDQRIEAVRASGQRLALLFTDIDEFKRVNDTLGHEAGDEALLQVAQRIASAVHTVAGGGALLARFGGDEFVILVSEGDVPKLALQLGALVVAELERPLLIQGREIFLGASIGITLFPDDATNATALLKNGDIAMYQAKLAGKNCYRYYSRAMDHAVERRMQMEHELRGAWDRGELHLVYQPIFRTRDRCLVGAEVLLRWQHPALGAISPSVFIAIAEQSGLIESIGPRVLRAACMEARQWPANSLGEELFVSVNVSSKQLRSGDLAGEVANCLRDSGLPAARLHLELTETAVIGDEMLAASLLEKLHRTGVKVWLDDFGTGFSGLSHLRQVPVDGVKIDKSFIADLQRDADDLALTTAIIAMAHALGITVVAEGIEQQAQFDLLCQRGCDLAQGYWLSHPLASAELVQLLVRS